VREEVLAVVPTANGTGTGTIICGGGGTPTTPPTPPAAVAEVPYKFFNRLVSSDLESPRGPTMGGLARPDTPR
jgi:hypothetical protein